MTGGTVNTNGNELHVGTTIGAFGMVNMSGGVLNISSTGAGNWPFSGIGIVFPNGGASGAFNMSGGSLQVAGATSIGTFTDDQGTLSISGGTMLSDQGINVGADGTGTMTLSGSGVVIASRVTEGEYGTGNGTLNLQGGLLRTGRSRFVHGRGRFQLFRRDLGECRRRQSQRDHARQSQRAGLCALAKQRDRRVHLGGADQRKRQPSPDRRRHADAEWQQYL